MDKAEFLRMISATNIKADLESIRSLVEEGQDFDTSQMASLMRSRESQAVGGLCLFF